MASQSTFRKPLTLKESLLATGFPSHKRHKNPNIYFYHQITLHTHGVRRAGRRRSICATWLLDATTASGSSISIRGTLQRAC